MATASYLVGSVGPEPVCPCRDAGSGELVCEEEEDPGGEGDGGEEGQTVERQGVEDHKFHHIPPNNLLL